MVNRWLQRYLPKDLHYFRFSKRESSCTAIYKKNPTLQIIIYYLNNAEWLREALRHFNFPKQNPYPADIQKLFKFKTVWRFKKQIIVIPPNTIKSFSELCDYLYNQITKKETLKKTEYLNKSRNCNNDAGSFG